MPVNLVAEREKLEARLRRRQIVPVQRASSVLLRYKEKDVLDFTHRDVLCLSKDYAVVRAAQKALTEFGVSTAASRSVSGGLATHLQAEERLAQHCGAQSSLLFNTRNQAILSLVSSLADERDCLLLSDELQTPFLDAAYLTDTECRYFSMQGKPSLLEVLPLVEHKRHVFIVIDVASALDGRLRDLKSLLAQCSNHDVSIILDESSSFGLDTKEVRTACMHGYMAGQVLASIVDFSELLGLCGAAIVGQKDLISLLTARSSVVNQEVPLAPSASASLLAALEQLALSVNKKQLLLDLIAKASDGLMEQGYTLTRRPNIPVVTIPMPSADMMLEFQQAAYECGVLVENYTARLPRALRHHCKATLSVQHTENTINKFLSVTESLRKKLF